MNFTDYQTKSRTTAKYPPIGHPVIYPTLGLTNEAGEVAGKIKKIFRDKGGVIGAAEREALKGEPASRSASKPVSASLRHGSGQSARLG